MRPFACFWCPLSLFQPPIVCWHPSYRSTHPDMAWPTCQRSRGELASSRPPASASPRSCPPVFSCLDAVASLEQVSHSGQHVVAICADKKIHVCELGREGGSLLALVGPATTPRQRHQKLPRDCRGATPGVPLMLTAQEHVIDEADSITSLSLSRDSRRATPLRVQLNSTTRGSV